METKDKNAVTNMDIIGASAGSGKTYTLCQRFHTALTEESNPPHVDQIVATTFTRKAATELRQRLRKKLLDAKRCDAALAVEDARINTVHSICLAILRENAFQAGLSPEISPLPEEVEDWGFDAATGSVLATFLNDNFALLQRLGLEEDDNRTTDDWKTSIRGIVARARANRMYPQDLRLMAQHSIATLEEMFPPKSALSEEESQKLEQKLRKAIEAVRQVTVENKTKKCMVPLKIDADTTRLLNAWRPGCPWSDWAKLAIVNKEKKTLEMHYGTIRDLAAQYPNHHLFRKDLHDCVTQVFACAADALEAYIAWKNGTGLVDFNDMEAETLNLLSPQDATAGQLSPDILDALDGRIRQIFVDEFQDTSPIQLALFLQMQALADKSTWIGDIKQAIYAFRGADPSLMQAVAAQSRGSSSRLDTSYRSRPALVNFANALFGPAFAHHDMTPKDVELLAHRSDFPAEKGGEAASLRFGILPPPKGISNIPTWQGLARSVRQLLQEKTLVADIQGEKEILRPVQAGDIAILCRSNSHCKAVAAMLGHFDIPAMVAMDGLQAQPEVRLCLAAYKYSMFMSKLALLEMLRLLREDTDWFADAMLHPEHIEQMPELQDIVTPLVTAEGNLRSRRHSLSPYIALREVVDILDMPRRVQQWGNAAHRLANVDAMLGQVLTYETMCQIRGETVTHHGCLKHFDEQDMEQAFGLEQDAVSVLTYHRAKGLEWPVVYLVDLDNAPKDLPFCVKTLPPKAETLDIHKPLKNRIIHYWPWPFGKTKNLPESMDSLLRRSPFVQSLKEQALEEELRLLYVGVTRARDILVFASKEINLANREKQWLPAAMRNVDLQLPTEQTQAFTIGGERFPCVWEEFTAGEDDMASRRARRPRIPARPQGEAPAWPPRSVQPSTDTSGEKGAVTLDAKNLVSITATPFAEDVVDAGDLPEQQRTGADRGTIFHNWLALAMMLPEDERPARAAAFAKQWGLTPAEEALLLPLCVNLHEGLRQLPVAQKLGTFLGYRTEWPLAYARKHETLPVHSLVNGEIDLLAIYEKGTIVVDHKFTKKTPDEAVKHYAPQLAAYREGLTCAGGFGEIHCCLHMPKQGVLVLQK